MSPAGFSVRSALPLSGPELLHDGAPDRSSDAITASRCRSLKTNARARPDHPAIIAADETINHGTAAERVKMLAAWLAARSITADDRIGLMLPDTPLHLLLPYALPWLGATIVPVDHRWTPDEAARIARAMRVKAILGRTDYYASSEGGGIAVLPRTLMNKPDRAMAKRILGGDSEV